MNIAFVFPGQRSQYVGMGRDLWDNFAEVKALYDEASGLLGYDVAKISFHGPPEELNKTFITQPCILTASIAAYTVLTSKGVKPSVVAGHSLGEYSAVVAAGVLSFQTAVQTTEKRGRFMQEAVPVGQGLMAAIIGLQRNIVEDICLSVSYGYVSPANFNAPSQVVIAGEKRAVEEAMKMAKEAGAKRVFAIAVSAPSHCTLMVDASERLSKLLDEVVFADPVVPVVNNADALFLTNGEKIKSSLIKQLNNPLLWEDSIQNIADTGINIFIEVGPGRILSGLIKRIEQTAKIYNVEDRESLEKTLTGLGV
jgi:[acyl-carrier-protein] S-malonyltransferase